MRTLLLAAALLAALPRFVAAQATPRDSLVTLLLTRAEGGKRSLLTRELVEHVVDDLQIGTDDLELLPSYPLMVEAEDLDGDGVPEIFLTHHGWCGTAGCTTWVYHRTSLSYHLVLTDIDVRALPSRTRGIRDLIATIHFGAPAHCDFIYRFRGLSYDLQHVVVHDSGRRTIAPTCPFEDAE